MQRLDRLPPMDDAKLAELARFFTAWGDWFRAAVRDSRDNDALERAAGVPAPLPGIEAVRYFADELAANSEAFERAAAQLLAMATAGEPCQVKRVDFGAVGNGSGQAHLRLVK